MTSNATAAVTLSALVALLFLATPADAQVATFEILHTDDFVGATLSADGNVVGISGASASGYAFARDLETGIGLFGTEGLGGATTPRISGDGSAAHGRVFEEPDEYYFYENGSLTFLPGATSFSPGGLSQNGSVIALTDSNRAALRMSGFGSPLQYLDAIPGTGAESAAVDVSASGAVAAGHVDTASGTSELFRWTLTGGLSRLGQFGGNERDTLAWAISADGLTIVGSASNPGSLHEGLAFRWQAGVFSALGSLPGDETALPFDVSGDGSRIVGSSGAGEFLRGGTAFLWDPHNGLRDMNVLLESLGIDLTNIVLEQASSISADGRTIVGRGFESDELNRPIIWKAVIPPVPEPTTALLLGLGLIGLSSERRREGRR